MLSHFLGPCSFARYKLRVRCFHFFFFLAWFVNWRKSKSNLWQIIAWATDENNRKFENFFCPPRPPFCCDGGWSLSQPNAALGLRCTFDQSNYWKVLAEANQIIARETPTNHRCNEQAGTCALCLLVWKKIYERKLRLYHERVRKKCPIFSVASWTLSRSSRKLEREHMELYIKQRIRAQGERLRWKRFA